MKLVDQVDNYPDSLYSGTEALYVNILQLGSGSVLDLNFDPESPPPGVVTIFGERAGDRLGIWVEAGDFDEDGKADLALGADQSVG